jgi:UPF0755 protein
MPKPLAAIVTVLVLALGVFQFFWIGASQGEKDVTVPRGAGVREIAGVLHSHGVIASRPLFEITARIWGIDRELRAGEYRFLPHSSVRAVLQQLTEGPRQVERMVRLIEGLNARDIAQLLATEIGLAQDDFLLLVRNPPERFFADFPWLPEKTKAIGLEGYLLGDTYGLLEDTRPEEVIRAMLKNFELKALPVVQKTPKGYPLDLHETMTLASVVESEVATWDDRRKVADIFLRRLRHGIALQADSTVNYITGKKQTRSSLDDLKNPSPYNTYKYAGLPPGPISSPSVLSIRAVLQPLHNTSWYFLTDPAGAVYYSRTFDEHKKIKSELYGS